MKNYYRAMLRGAELTGRGLTMDQLRALIAVEEFNDRAGRAWNRGSKRPEAREVLNAVKLACIGRARAICAEQGWTLNVTSALRWNVLDGQGRELTEG